MVAVAIIADFVGFEGALSTLDRCAHAGEAGAVLDSGVATRREVRLPGAVDSPVVGDATYTVWKGGAAVPSFSSCTKWLLRTTLSRELRSTTPP